MSIAFSNGQTKNENTKQGLAIEWGYEIPHPQVQRRSKRAVEQAISQTKEELQLWKDFATCQERLHEAIRERDAVLHREESRIRDLEDMARIVRRLARSAHKDDKLDQGTLEDIKNLREPIFKETEMEEMDPPSAAKGSRQSVAHVEQQHTAQPYTVQQHTAQPHSEQQYNLQQHTAQPQNEQQYSEQQYNVQQYADIQHATQPYMDEYVDPLLTWIKPASF